MKSSTAKKVVLFSAAVLAVWYSFFIIQPPESRHANSDLTTFSAARAFRHVKKIATRPHPLGSAANDSVRNYILEELRNMKLQPEVLKGVGVSRSFGQALAGYSKNIFAKIRGHSPQRTILLMAHYDSAPNALGAADDASGVAAILESIRAIQSQEIPLNNNVWILFTDGEERGLLGAEQFVDEFAEIDKIDLVLNFEARGTSGASMMFETSSPNGNLIPSFASATPDPVANSLMYTVYKMLPNDTDMSITKKAGINGINFAFTEQFTDYHTLQDNPENLSLASLQHHGSNLLNNLRHFGNTDFKLSSNTEYVYFNNATGGLTYYPAGWSFPIALVTAILFFAYLVYLFRTDRLGLGSYAGSFGLFMGSIVIGTAITYFGWKGISWLHPQYEWFLFGENYNHKWYLLGFTCLNAAFFCVIYSWIQKKLSTQQLLAGSFTAWILFSLVSAWYLPTASYFFSWPVLMALIGWVVLGDDISNLSWKSILLLAISLSGVLFMIPPYIYLIQVMLTTRMIAVSMLLLLLMIGLCWALVWQIIQTRPVLWSTVLLLTGVICFIIASLNSGFSVRHKKQNDINYVQDINTKRAYWVSRDFTTDSWTRQFLNSGFKRGPVPENRFFGDNSSLLYTSAPSMKIPSPEIQILADSSSDSLRHLSLRLNAQQKGIGTQISWNENLSIVEFNIHGKQVFDKYRNKDSVVKSLNRISYFQDLSEPIKMELTYIKRENAVLYFNFVKPGLPTKLIPHYQERPHDMMPAPYHISNSTISQSRVDLDTLK
jgi:hypothetical protein